MVFTGSGKGKTTAAMGMGFRAAGHGLKVIMIQFIKGGRHYGELDAAGKLAPFFQIVPMGKGFIGFDQKEAFGEHIEAVRTAWDYFKERMASGEFQMIILDEINNAIDYGLLPVKEVLEAIENRPEGLHLVLTGRNAHPDVIEKADLVTEMKEIKHPFHKGVKAQKGVEF